MASTQDIGTTKVKLYWLEKSRSQRILWLLEELKLPYEVETFKRGKDMLADPKGKEIHPLGKFPVISVESEHTKKPLILAESAFITEYLSQYFGKELIPKQYQQGLEGQIGAETEEWLRYRHFMHYAEGSLMTILLVAFVVQNIKTAPVPFFIKPITGMIANKINSTFIEPNVKTHFSFIEEQLKTSPKGGKFLCGESLTGADILMSFPLEMARGRVGLDAETFPHIYAYVENFQQREAYKAAVQKIVDIEGSYSPNL